MTGTILEGAPLGTVTVTDFLGVVDQVTAGFSRLESAFLRAASNARARPLQLNASAICNTSGNALLIFDACPADRIWSVRRIVVGGDQWATAAQGAAQVVVSTSPQGYVSPGGAALNIPITDVVDVAASLPNRAFYTGDGWSIPIYPRQYLAVAITGGTSTQQYVAAAQLDDWPLAYSSKE